MSQNLFLVRWMHLGVVALLMAGQLAYADDKSSVPDGYKEVKLPTGGSVLVRETESQPTSAKEVSDKYNPMDYDMNQTSPLANKSFASGSASFAQKNASFDRSSYAVKPYVMPTGSDQAVANLNAKFPTSAGNGYNRSATGLDKTFTLANSNPVEGKPALFASGTSSYQGRTALLNGQPESLVASPLADKSYEGDLPVIKREVNKINFGDMQAKDLPDRPLTIDEVRALINHGVTPDTTVKPGPQSKALNDPDYQPEPSPPPPDAPAPAPTSEDDKNDPVPSPGTMAQPPPENSESLPQH